MSYQFTAGRFKGWASDNTPLAGGRLYTYSSGTTTHKAAYTDATLGAACAYVSDGVGGLYIALDSKGEAQLWLGSGAYTFKLTDSSGSTVWTVDGVRDQSEAALSQLSASSGSSLVGVMQSGSGAVARTLQDKARETVSVKDFGAAGDGVTDDTQAILDAASYVSGAGGGKVFFPSGRYFVNLMSYTDNFMGYDNVEFVGEKMPTLSANADRLEGGAIICGGFYAFAHNFAIRDIGFDLGKYVMDTKYPTKDSLTGDRPTSTGVGGWDAFSFVRPNVGYAIQQARNFVAENVICLLSRPGSFGHAFLTENINGGYINNVIGVYGVHAIVFKNENLRVGSIAGYMAGTDNVIIKSDSYAPCGKLTIDQIQVGRDFPNVTPWTSPTDTTYGVYFNPATASFSGPIQIGRIQTKDCQRGVLIRGGASYTANKIQIDTLSVVNGSVLGIGADTCDFYEIQVGRMNADGVGVGIAANLTSSTNASMPKLKIESAQLLNVTNWAVQASGYARLKIDTLEIKVAGYAYYNENNARIMVGKEEFSGVVSKWYTSGLDPAPALSVSYSDAAGYMPFTVSLDNYGVQVSGSVRYDGGGTPTQNATFATFPTYLRPTSTRLLSTVRKTGTSYAGIGAGMTSGGSLTHNEGNSLPAVNDVISLDFSWDHI